MVGWHYQLSGHEFEQTPGDCEGQGSLACCSPWSHRVRHNLATELQAFSSVRLRGSESPEGLIYLLLCSQCQVSGNLTSPNPQVHTLFLGEVDCFRDKYLTVACQSFLPRNLEGWDFSSDWWDKQDFRCLQKHLVPDSRLFWACFWGPARSLPLSSVTNSRSLKYNFLHKCKLV